MRVAKLFEGLILDVRQRFCDHDFLVSDIEITGIPYPEKPGKDAPFSELMAWQQSLYTCDAHRKRVKCPCQKCGKVFFAHCGLDILALAKRYSRPLRQIPEIVR